MIPRTYKPNEVAEVLLYLGWAKRRGKGSHRSFTKHGNPNTISVSMSKGDVPTSTLRKIIKNTGLEKPEWERIAREVL